MRFSLSAGFFMCPHINSVNREMPVQKGSQVDPHTTYIVIGTAAWNVPERKLNDCNFTFTLLCLMKIHLLHNCQNHNFFFISNFILLFVQFFYEILQSIEGKKCQVPRCFVKYFFAPHSWPLLHFHIAHGGLLTFSSVLSCVGTVDCTIFKTCRFIETAKILIRY